MKKAEASRKPSLPRKIIFDPIMSQVWVDLVEVDGIFREDVLAGENPEPFYVETLPPNFERIERIVLKIIECEGVVYELNHQGRNASRLRCNIPDFLACMEYVLENIPSWKDIYTPRMSLIIGLVSEFFNCDDSFNAPESKSVLDERSLWEHANALASRIKKEVSSAAFSRRESHWRGYADRRIERGVEYINGLFGKYGKLLVVRVDLYGKKYSKREVAMQLLHEDCRTHTPFSDLCEMLEEFSGKYRRKKSIFGDVVGRIIKIEYAPYRGHHIHAMFFLNGAKVDNDSYYSNEIGRYWVNAITGGSGAYFACNRFKARYKRLGIGLISHSEAQKRADLIFAMTYLAKSDMFLKSKLSTKQKLFRIGHLPRRPEGGARMGRPRNSSAG